MSVVKMRKQITNLSGDMLDWVTIAHRRRRELIKYEDPRRKAIYSSVVLTAQQEKDIDDFYISNYGEKIPHIWHRHFTAYTGMFDVQYFPELLFIPEFEHFMNLYPEYVKVYTDKNVLPAIAASAGVQMPQTLLSCTKGLFRDAEGKEISKALAIEWLKNAGEVFIKPSVDSDSGRECSLLQMHNGKDECSGDTAINIIERMGKDFVAQQRLVCSDDIRRLHPSSCNTFRVITYRWKDSIESFPVIMRIGRHNSCVDNAHAGGVFIGVERDGTLKKTAFTEFADKFDRHPDTGVVFENYQIAGFEKVMESALKMHVAMPQTGVVNWDFTIDQNNEPILIEANLHGGAVWVVEMAHGCGAFGDNTADVLQWMRKAKKMKHSERERIAFGQD